VRRVSADAAVRRIRPAQPDGRRKFFKLAEVGKAPLAVEAVRRIDAIFTAERAINGLPADQRLAGRRETISPLVGDIEAWMRAVRSKLSRHAAVAIDYILKRWDSFVRFVTDGRICLSNYSRERALRGVVLGRAAWLFARSERGGEPAAAICSLIVTAWLNDLDPRAWLADVLVRIADQPVKNLHELLPWAWNLERTAVVAAE
jgi:transposase